MQSANTRRFCQKNFVEIPTLSERLPNLADYAIKLVQNCECRTQRSHRNEFTEAAINPVLSSPWKGNFNELSLALLKVVSIGADEPIFVEDLAKCISGEAVENAERAKSKEASEHLKSFLCYIQERFIRKFSDATPLPIAPFCSPDEDLLYPDLISPDSGAAA